MDRQTVGCARVTYLTYKGSGGGSGGSMLRTCLLILLGVVAVILAFTAFAFLLAGLALFGVFKLVRGFFTAPKNPPRPRTETAAPPIPQQESAFAAGDVVDVPYIEVTAEPVTDTNK